MLSLAAPMDESIDFKRARFWCVLASVFFLTYCFVLAAKSIAGFPLAHETHRAWPWLGDKPVGEDGFYMLTVANNLATTHHLVYTYSMPATGIQPLATVVFAGVASMTNHFGGDLWTLIRAVLVLGSVLFAGFSWMMGALAASFAPVERKPLVFALAFYLVLFDYTLFRLFTYGLETGIYLCAMGLCMMVWQRLVRKPKAGWSDIVWLGVAGGLAGLARIDFGLLFAFLLGFLLLRRMASWLQVFSAGLLALLITSPWFWFVHRVSGSWLPSSGKAESRLIDVHHLSRATVMADAVMGHLAMWSYAGSGVKLAVAVAAISLIGIVMVLMSAEQTRRSLGSRAMRNTLLPWGLGVAALAAVYLLLFWSSHFYARYVSPMVLVWVPVLALALSALSPVQRRPWVPLTVLALTFCAWDVASLHRGHVGSAQLISAGYIHTYYPEARVGAFQSGTLGYFNSNVENLDGKLNQGALKAAAAHRLEEFVDREKIDVLLDWPGYLHLLDSNYLEREWEPCPQPMTVADSICLVRKRIR